MAKKHRTLYLSSELIAYIDEVAEAIGRSRSEVITASLSAFFALTGALEE